MIIVHNKKFCVVHNVASRQDLITNPIRFLPASLGRNGTAKRATSTETQNVTWDLSILKQLMSEAPTWKN